MRPGTHGFVGDRLKEAREARELSASALADLVGISRTSISQYENGNQTPSPYIMREISETLRLPIHFFLAPPSPSEVDAIFYRSLESATKSVRLQMERRFGWLRETVAYLRRFIQFPKVNFPDFGLPVDPARISAARIESIAMETRRHWRLADNPISNLIWLVENNGAVVSRHELGSEELDAFSQWNTQEATPYFVLGSDKPSAVRGRYNVAHELGHIILHRHIRRETLNTKAMFRLIEAQAHRFAGAFCLPAERFADEFISAPTLDHFLSLKPKWKASIQFMIMRSSDLDIISPEQKRRLMINLANRAWRKSEPYDETMEPECPLFLKRSIEMLVSHRIIDPTEIPFQTRLSSKDIEELTGLEPGFLTSAAKESAAILRASKRDEPPSDTDPDIIKFPWAL